MGKKDHEVFWTKKMPPTDLNHTESENHVDICSKNYHNISDGVDTQQLLSDNLKDPIDNYDIGKVDDKVPWTEEISPTNPNCTKSKRHDDNCNSNYDSNRVGNE